MKKLLLLTLATVFLTSCANNPTRGDKMLALSSQAESFSKKWNQGDILLSEGRAMRSEGNNLILKGQKQIEKGNDLIADGNNNISSGSKMSKAGQEKIEQGLLIKKETEVSFKNKFPNSNI